MTQFACLMVTEMSHSITALSTMQGDTALHIARRKSSLDVAEVISSSEGAKDLQSVQNKVLQ